MGTDLNIVLELEDIKKLCKVMGRPYRGDAEPGIHRAGYQWEERVGEQATPASFQKGFMV